MIAEGECIGGIRLVAAIGRPTLALGARSSRRSARAWCPSRDYGPLAFFLDAIVSIRLAWCAIFQLAFPSSARVGYPAVLERALVAAGSSRQV